MSDPERTMRNREWSFYIQDMIDFCDKAQSYTSGMDFDAFVADELIYDATLHNLQLIGEAATRIPKHVRQAYPDIQWRDIIGTRNRLAHSYLTISNNIIWNIIQNDIPDLQPKLREILQETRKQQNQ